jgi:ubiquinone biosynthesis protein
MAASPQAIRSLPVRDLGRLATIVRIAAGLGWGHYIAQLRLHGHLPALTASSDAPRSTDATRLRLALEELGPTFVKFGQMLSVRRDLFEKDLIYELQKLQDNVPPFPGQVARAIVEKDLGRPIAGLFSTFEDTPFAAASVAQVHAATLFDGTAVVVKVQRPDIEKMIRADLEILFFLARLLKAHVAESRRFDPLGLVEEFAETIGRELDFRLEGHNAERFRENFKHDPAVVVPRIFWEVSSRRVLTMERSPGRKIGADSIDATKRATFVQLLARLYLVQVFEHGFIHGDPHPGNVFLVEDGRVCFHDFGIVGRLSPRDQEDLRQLFLALITRDAAWMADVYLEMGVAGTNVDRRAFVQDLDQALDQYYANTAHATSFAAILNEFIQLGGKHELHPPRQLLLVAKAFILIESQGRSLDPNFNMLASLQNYAPLMLRLQFAPDKDKLGALVKGSRALRSLRAALSGLPQALSQLIAQLKTGTVTVHVQHEHLEELQHGIDRASNRLSLSLIIAAVVVGSSIVTAFHAGPHYNGTSLLGLVGYVVASVLGLWWAVGILRSGKL